MKTPFYSALIKTHHAQRAKMRPCMQEIGLSVGQPKVLNYLVDHPCANQKDIAFACDIEPATVSKLIDTMQEKGLLVKKLSEQDRRYFCVDISELGRKKQKLWITHCLQIEEEALHGFSKEEREQFSVYLCRMYKNLSNREIE